MTFEPILGEHGTTIRLIDRLRAEYLPALKAQMEDSRPSIRLELDEVTLVDVDVVRFLGVCELNGIELYTAQPTDASGSPES
jgi:hypothetical protein